MFSTEIQALSCPLFIACIVLITYLGGQERLYCTDERLDIAYDDPSLFCQMSGIENTTCNCNFDYNSYICSCAALKQQKEITNAFDMRNAISKA